MPPKEAMTKVPMERRSLLDAVTSRTKVIALITLIIEAVFLAGVYALPEPQRISVFYPCIAVLAATLAGLFWLEHSEVAAKGLAEKARVADSELSSAPPHPPKYQMEGGRAKVIAGVWKGDGNQEVGPDGNPLPLKVTFSFRVSSTLITGDGVFCALFEGVEHELRFDFSGGFLYGQFLRFEFDRPDEHVVNFGSIILRLSDDANRLTGRFHGYGARSERIVYGTLELRKVA